MPNPKHMQFFEQINGRTLKSSGNFERLCSLEISELLRIHKKCKINILFTMYHPHLLTSR